MQARKPPQVTPDLRYIVVRGRLWRRADPDLPEERRRRLVQELMTARREIGAARRTGADLTALRAKVDATKVALGERGPVWWTDGAPDLNRHLVHTTCYAMWFEALPPTDRE